MSRRRSDPQRVAVLYSGAILGHVPQRRMTEAVAVVLAFNEAINGGDLAALTELMTASHRFVDSTGATIAGRTACLEA